MAQRHLIVCQPPAYQGSPVPVTQNLRLACEGLGPFVGSLPSLGSGSREPLTPAAIAPSIYVVSPQQPLWHSLFLFLDASTSAFFSPASSSLPPGPGLPSWCPSLSMLEQSQLHPYSPPQPHFATFPVVTLSPLLWASVYSSGKQVSLSMPSLPPGVFSELINSLN